MDQARRPFDYGEQRYIGIGGMDNRIVLVAFTEIDEDTLRIISMRKAKNMSVQNLKTDSKTDWARIDSMTDEEIDTSDIPELDEEFFKNAKLRLLKDKRSVILSLDPEVVEWFEKQGPDFQYRINAALKIYADAHR